MNKALHLISAIVVLQILSGCDFSTSKTPLFYEGQPIESVQKLLGEPDGKITSGSQTVLLYGSERLKFIAGKWVDAKPDIRSQIRKGNKSTDRQVSPAAPQQIKGDPLYRDLVVGGQVTVIDFYATWCGPCRQLAPTLDRLVQEQGVALRKIDIIDWDSTIATKYDIQSVPNVRVFDKYGRMVGSPTSNPGEISSNIAQAKQIQ